MKYVTIGNPDDEQVPVYEDSSNDPMYASKCSEPWKMYVGEITGVAVGSNVLRAAMVCLTSALITGIKRQRAGYKVLANPDTLHQQVDVPDKQSLDAPAQA